MINFRTHGKEFVSNNDLYIFIVKKSVNTARGNCELAIILEKNNLEISVKILNTHTPDSGTQLWGNLLYESIFTLQ